MKTRTVLAVLLLAATGAVAAAGPAASAAPLQGEVLEVRDASSYTYLRLKTRDGETWAAVTQVAVKKGAQVTIVNPAVMLNFESKALNKTFDKIVFGTIAGPNAPTQPAMSMAMPHGAMGGAAAAAPPPVAKVAKASGADARTVAEVVGERAALKDKRVSLRGQVVKATHGILGRNWFHLQDGSGQAGAGTHDVVVTSTDKATVGDIVTVQGTVRTDVKIGAGYEYTVLIGDASVKK